MRSLSHGLRNGQERCSCPFSFNLCHVVGRERTRPLRPDWERVKDNVMREAVRQKFLIHADIRQCLLDTGDAMIVENAPGDYY